MKKKFKLNRRLIEWNDYPKSIEIEFNVMKIKFNLKRFDSKYMFERKVFQEGHTKILQIESSRRIIHSFSTSSF